MTQPDTNSGEEEYQYLPHGKPLPEGWDLANDLQGTSHGHHAVLLKKKKSMGGHETPNEGETDEWLTPPYIIEKLGTFELDPCSPIKRPWDTAKTHYTIEDNGLIRQWEGRVWLNPPYGRIMESWLARMAEHNNGIALTFARTETRMFHKYIWEKATALHFFKGRLFFHYVNGDAAKGNAGAPSVLIAYGKENAEILENAGFIGKYVRINS
jgi:hypothetical protein